MKKSYIKHCANSTCGKEFLTSDNRVKYCSDQCRHDVYLLKVKECQKNKNKNREIVKNCSICGAEFIDKTINHSQNTCSPEHAKIKKRQNWMRWVRENPDSYKESQKRSIQRKTRTGYWKKYWKKRKVKEIMLKTNKM